jgi:hypothetical protein
MAFLGKLEAQEKSRPEGSNRSPSEATLTDLSESTITCQAAAPSRRLRALPISESRLFEYLRAQNPCSPNAFRLNPPPDAHVVGFEPETAGESMRLLISSNMFTEVAQGEEIPDLAREWVG